MTVTGSLHGYPQPSNIQVLVLGLQADTEQQVVTIAILIETTETHLQTASPVTSQIISQPPNIFPKTILWIALNVIELPATGAR